jgi:hypothetical protein
MWRKYMNFVLKDMPIETFDTSYSNASTTPNHLNGNYCASGAGTILRFMGGSGSKGGQSDPQYNLWNAPILAGNYCTNGDTGEEEGVSSTTTAENQNTNIIEIPPTPVIN